MSFQFFITLRDNLEYLDQNSTVFGKVVDGFDTLDTINDAFVDNNLRPFTNIRIKHTVVLRDPFDDSPELIKIYPSISPEGKPRDEVEILRLEYERTKLSEDELSEQIRATDARCSATLLEILGDLPHRDIKPEENVLFVCKLNPKTIDESLAKAFSFYGRVKAARVNFDRKTGESKRFGFVEFETKKACEDAYMKIQTKSVYVDGHKLVVDFSQSTANSWGRFERERPRQGAAAAAGVGHSRNLCEEIRQDNFSERQRKKEKRAAYDRVRKERLLRTPDRGYSWKNDRRGSRWSLDSTDDNDESSWG